MTTPSKIILSILFVISLVFLGLSIISIFPKGVSTTCGYVQSGGDIGNDRWLVLSENPSNYINNNKLGEFQVDRSTYEGAKIDDHLCLVK